VRRKRETPHPNDLGPKRNEPPSLKTTLIRKKGGREGLFLNKGEEIFLIFVQHPHCLGGEKRLGSIVGEKDFAACTSYVVGNVTQIPSREKQREGVWGKEPCLMH